MNGLTLRISGGNKMRAPAASLPPVTLAPGLIALFQNVDSKHNDFVTSSTAEKQLAALKNILNADDITEDAVKFAAIVFLAAEPKHPIKCYLTRHITKMKNLQNSFERHLAEELIKRISNESNDIATVTETVGAVISCSENFPSGSAALKNCEVELFVYLKKVLSQNMEVLQSRQSLSPTEKNEVFTLMHNILRAILNVVQKVNGENTQINISSLTSVYEHMDRLFNEKDTPLDTKSLCAIVKVTMLSLEHEDYYWKKFLASIQDTPCQDTDAAINRICLYSAVITVVPIQQLEMTQVEGESGLAVIVREVLNISEKFSVEPLVALSVARTLLNLTKALHKSSGTSEGIAASVSILSFVWAHVEHFMDSVRHLTSQVLSNVLKYFGKHQNNGFPKVFDIFFSELISLSPNKKAYYVGLSASASVLGTEVILERLPGLIDNLIDMLANQAVQANVATTIETLLHQHTQQVSTERVYSSWIRPVLNRVYDSAQSDGSVDTTTLNILENIIAKAVRWDAKIMDFILPEAKKQCSSIGDVKCVLVCLNLARRMGSLDNVTSQGDKWKGILGYDVIRTAMVNSSEEIRILALSLLIETSKTTEPFTQMEFELVLLFLKYNINTQAPNMRHLTLSLLKKLMKRLESSHRVLTKQTTPKDETAPSVGTYEKFLNTLRAQCVDNLLPGANYSRRAIALQILVWCEGLQLEGYKSEWCEDYVDKLLLHLEDSYENNKILALEALTHCPREYLVKSYSVSLQLPDILQEASSVKPPDCISAAYKLQLLQKTGITLPKLLAGGDIKPKSEQTTFVLLQAICSRLKEELSVAEESILLAASSGPMYGLLLCARHLLVGVDVNKLSTDTLWTSLISSIITTCISITSTVAPIVNNSSPEGHLPMDGDPGHKHLESEGNGLVLDTGVKVTAQMVLLCAWRSVKEVSLLLGEISSRLHIHGERKDDPTGGNLTHEDILRIGDHFTTLLAETKHRGAFEQAYVGFTKLCARLWRCTNSALHGLPRAWLAELMEAITSGDKSGKLCATRRSAGVPFMIQALVTTELQVSGNPVCFHECMSSLLRLADFTTSGVSIETRTHCLNILRALFRHTALGEVVNGYVGSGLVIAIRGFDGTTWAERNSSTLLFSSLMVRIFGVQRSKDTDKLCIRNKMTGRTFFLRYPSLYDFMLDKLLEVGRSEGRHDLLRPSLYPVLLLLARLYPYSLEESTTNLQLAAFIPHVQACGSSCVLKTRQLAAKAIVPLISHDKYIFHLNELLRMLGNKDIKRNFCHGLLLQLIRLLEWKPENLKVDPSSYIHLSLSLSGTLWILEEVLASRPCYVTADEYTKLIHLLLWRFPTLVETNGCLDKISQVLKQLFTSKPKPQFYGKDVFLANAFNLYVLILLKTQENVTPEVIYENLNNDSHDVVLAVLNFLLVLHNVFEVDCKFLKHIQELMDEKIRTDILAHLDGMEGFKDKLFHIVQNKTNLESTQKALTVLSYLEDTQMGLVDLNEGKSEEIVTGLLKKIQNEHENVSHIYITSLRRYIKRVQNEMTFDEKHWVEIVTALYENCSSDNTYSKRRNVVEFLEENLLNFMRIQLKKLNKSETFEYYATIWTTIVTLLEDDEEILRQRTSDLVLKLAHFMNMYTEEIHQVIPSRASEILLDIIGKYHEGFDVVAVYLVIAILDFNSEVCIGDEITDECRVFDQSEKYNTFLEESNWTKECVKKIKQTNAEYKNCIQIVIQNNDYSTGFRHLCSQNYSAFIKLLNHNIYDETVNPKVRYCIKDL